MAKKEFIRLLKGLDDEDLVKVIGECKRLKLRSQIKYLRLILIKYLLLLVVAAYCNPGGLFALLFAVSSEVLDGNWLHRHACQRPSLWDNVHEMVFLAEKWLFPAVAKC